jgi:MOSC domain-containing protein YiiM
MEEISTATLVVGQGLLGNVGQGRRRQVTLIEQEVWATLMAELSAAISPAARRANLMVSSLPLAETRGRLLQVGECQLRIAGETEPCHRMDEALLGLKNAMVPDWRGGAFAEVLVGGAIAVGDQVIWAD